MEEPFLFGTDDLEAATIKYLRSRRPAEADRWWPAGWEDESYSFDSAALKENPVEAVLTWIACVQQQLDQLSQIDRRRRGLADRRLIQHEETPADPGGPIIRDARRLMRHLRQIGVLKARYSGDTETGLMYIGNQLVRQRRAEDAYLPMRWTYQDAIDELDRIDQFIRDREFTE